jgi:hypothetical protein
LEIDVTVGIVMAIGTEPRFDLDELMTELRRYLAAVDAFRAEGHEPVWLREERRPAALARGEWEPCGDAAPTPTG